jgi:hypothetical protein
MISLNCAEARTLHQLQELKFSFGKMVKEKFVFPKGSGDI